MSDNCIKWIPLGGMELSPANLAAAEKLRKFGFSLIFSEFGSEKLTKTGLCIYDVLAEKENPNILLIASNRELYGWYRILMTGIGADFKIISGAPDALMFFSEDCPNLFLMSSDALSKSNGLKAKARADFKWDLIVIDEEQESDVPNYSFYKDNIPWKTEKLVVTAAFPVKNDEQRSELISLIKALMADEALAAAADDMELNDSCIKLDADCPAMRYYDEKVYSGELKRNIEFCEYTIDESTLSSMRRRIDLRSGLPVYKYGGNIFEEYDSDELKRIYQKPAYIRSDVEDLRRTDKKLDSFLTLLDDILADEKQRAIVYCCEKNTLDHLRKVLSCVYGSENIKTARGELFSREDILRKLRVDDSTKYPRIILGVDGLGAVGDALDRVNCIINYELPASAALLERRMTRHGAKNEAQRRFVIFRDTNKLFDSRMLDKVLYGSILGGFCGGVPSRNILLDMPNKAECLNNLIADLKYTSGYAKEVENCFDLVKKFKGDYALLGAEKISNSRQLADFSAKLLERVLNVFGLSEDCTAEDISAAINSLDGLCTVEDGRLVKVPAETLKAAGDTFRADSWKSLSFAAEAVTGLENAKKHIDELHAGENFHLTVKNELAELGGAIQYPVLFGIWRYRVREQDSERSFRDYIRIYNDGI